jgi:tricarballylate dehydrogenase
MYAKVGSAVQGQPGCRAFQIFDSKWLDAPLETDFYFLGSYDKAETLEELAEKIGIPKKAFLEEITAYNQGINENTPFNPFHLDGRYAANVTPPRSNFARKIDQPPFWAFQVSGGITFTYGGIKINTKSQVLDISDRIIPGLFAAGELTGGFFYYSYPGASGLMRGAVTGYTAGRSITNIK